MKNVTRYNIGFGAIGLVFAFIIISRLPQGQHASASNIEQIKRDFAADMQQSCIRILDYMDNCVRNQDSDACEKRVNADKWFVQNYHIPREEACEAPDKTIFF